jgi:hypothetical protein
MMTIATIAVICLLIAAAFLAPAAGRRLELKSRHGCPCGRCMTSRTPEPAYGRNAR